MKNELSQKGTLLIDGQVFQTPAWHRGMGKYSLSFLESVFPKGVFERYDEVKIILNSNLEADQESIKTVQERTAGAEFIWVDLAVPKPGREISDLRIENKQKLASVVGDRTDVDYLILSLFIDEACTVFPTNARNKQIIFYDLIPFLYHQRYEKRINFKGYLDHFATIFEADHIFTISQTVANDMEVFLGISRDKLTNINGASINRADLDAKKPNAKIGEKFILMPSGDELRKNNLRAVAGFEEFNAANNNEYKLVLTSFFSDFTTDELNAMSDNLVFTGNIPEAELQWLYANAELVLFASEYEGLGLPILEAMSVDRKIACSDIPVFKEILADTMYFFDHLDSSSIAKTIGIALTSYDDEARKKAYDQVLKKYTWANTAKAYLQSVGTNVKSEPAEIQKPKVAVLTPHPSGFSAIGKVVAECHDSFRKHYDVDYYYDYGTFHRSVRPDYLSHVATTFDVTEFNAARYAEYDFVVYHIGNSDYHLETIKAALHLPGYVVLHDTFLGGAFEILANTGYMSEDRLFAEQVLNGQEEHPLSEYLTSISNNQLGILTHSQYAADATQAVTLNQVPIMVAQLPVTTPNLIEKDKTPHLQIGLAGIIADVKGIAIVEELAASELYKNCTINIFGYNFAKPQIVEQFRKWPHVKIHPNPTDFEFQSKLSKLDVLVNYRLEYRGETSLTALEAMRYGVVVVVRGDVGWYSELPDGTVLKATTIDDAVKSVEKAIMSNAEREKISKAAANYTAKYHTHEAYAAAFAEIVEMAKQSELHTIEALIKDGEIQKVKELLRSATEQ